MTAVTWNPADKHADITLSGGDLVATNTTAAWRAVRATDSKSSGKYYFEVLVTGTPVSVGMALAGSGLTVPVGSTSDYGLFADNAGDVYGYNLAYPGATLLSGATYPATIGVAVDLDANKIWFSWNGSWLNSGDPAAGTGEVFSGASGTYYPAFSAYCASGSRAGTLHATTASFTYSAPSGFDPWDATAPPWTGPSVGSAAGQSTATARVNVIASTGASSGTSSASARGNSTGIFPICTWDAANKHANITLSDGGKKASAPSGGSYAVLATKFRDRGRYYFEIDLTGSNASAGLAGAAHPLDAYIGGSGAGDAGVRWSSTGFVEYTSDLHTDPSGVGFPQPLLLRFAIDFEAARMWIGDNAGFGTGWIGKNNVWDGDPATGESPTFVDQARIGHIPLAPAFASASGAATTAILRTAWPYLRNAPPAGFMPWDDYLDASIAIGSSSGSAIATGASQCGIAAGSGTSTAQGAGACLVAFVGAASGTGTAAAFEEIAVAESSGSSTAAAFASRVVASSVGVSSSTSVGFKGRAGAGSAAGSATVYGQSYAREINTTSTASASHTGLSYFGSNGASYLKDGFTLFTGADPVTGSQLSSHLGDYDSDGSLDVRMTWATEQTLNGIELYSSAWCDERFIGANPDGTETFPANVGGAVNFQIYYDTDGFGTWAPVLPEITGNNLIRRQVIFPQWLDTKAIRVVATSDSDYIRLQELKVFTPVIVTVLEAESVAVETSELIAVHTIEFESTADANSTVVEKGYAKLTDGGVATDTVSIRWTVQAAGEAGGTSSAAAYTVLEEVLEDGGVASDLVTFARALALHSDGVLATSLSGKLTHTEESTGEATAELDGENVITQSEESTGVATDTVIGIRRVTVIEISGGVGSHASVETGHAELTLVSRAQAASVAVQHSVQSETLESSGFAEETLPAPFQGSFPVFWTNSVSTGAATWEGLPFNSFIEADGVVYAAGPSGIFEMGDEINDLDAEVQSEVEWDLVDSGSVQMKRMRSVYVNARTRAPFTVRLANEQGIFEYLTETADATTLTNHRAAVGRGILSRNTRLSLLHTKAYVAEDAGVGILESPRRI